MTYTQVLDRPGTLGVRSPADVLLRPSLTGFLETRRRSSQSNTPEGHSRRRISSCPVRQMRSHLRILTMTFSQLRMQRFGTRVGKSKYMLGAGSSLEP